LTELYDAICSDDSPSLKSIAIGSALMVGGSSLKLVGHDVVRACFLASWAEHDKAMRLADAADGESDED